MTEALPEANRREWWKFQRWISTDCRVKLLVGRSDRRDLAYGLEDALLNMRTLDALRRSAQTAAWERV